MEDFHISFKNETDALNKRTIGSRKLDRRVRYEQSYSSFFDHLHNVTRLSFMGAEDERVRSTDEALCRMSFLRAPLHMRHFRKLKVLVLSNYVIVPPLVDFVLVHTEPLEEIYM
jgi:hypothetical protein